MTHSGKAAPTMASQPLFARTGRAIPTTGKAGLPCKEFNHKPGLGSILRLSPAPPAQRLKAALILLGDLTMRDMLTDLSCSHLSYLSRVVNHNGHSNVLREEIARFLSGLAANTFGDSEGVAVTDIWPPESHNPTVEQS